MKFKSRNTNIVSIAVKRTDEVVDDSKKVGDDQQPVITKEIGKDPDDRRTHPDYAER